MSQLEVDKVIPQSGTTLTLGESGDTITIASGATFTPTLIAPIIDEINDNNGNEEIIFTTTTSAVNELTIANAATGNAPEIAATGDDTDIDLKLTPKGAGNLVLDGIEFPNADGSASQVLQTNGSGVLSFATPAAGITMADMWRYTATTQQPSGDLTANFERADDASSGFIGTGMTESSGIFSFPSTGIYLINASVGFNFVNQADNNANITINVTLNNSTYDAVAIIFSGSNSGGGNSRFSQYGHAMVDVTDITNVKVKFAASSFEANSYLEGDTDKNDTAFSFIRLGDT
jgi:hypothetical protein